MKYSLIIFISFALSANIKAQNNLKKYTFDEPAKFTGNNNDFVTYIADHVNKPELITNDVKGRLVIKVDVDPSGKASVLNIEQRISPEVDTEFVKAILASPTWIPAKLRGKPVSHLQMLYYDIDLNKAKSAMVVTPLNAKPKKPDQNSVYSAVEIQPSFAGGEKKLREFLAENLKYPAQAKTTHPIGPVFLQFIVEIDGSLSNIKIIRDPGSGMGDEAVRVMKLSPKWTPGIQDGVTVRVQYTLPVRFTL